jgi:omega-6 fatty acid desaturase (delta-12 desaturase)
VHHLSSRIPFYRLPQVLRDYPQLASVGRVTFLRSLRCAALALWDEDQQRLISFRELRADGRGCRQLSARPISDEAAL